MQHDHSKLKQWFHGLSSEERQVWELWVGLGGKFYSHWLRWWDISGRALQKTLDTIAEEYREIHPGYYQVDQAKAYLYFKGQLDAEERKGICLRICKELTVHLEEGQGDYSQEEWHQLLQVLGKAALNSGNLLAATNSYVEAITTYQQYAGILEPYCHLPEIGTMYLRLATSGHWLSYRLAKPIGNSGDYDRLQEKARELKLFSFELIIEALRITHLELTSSEALSEENRINELLDKFAQLEPRSKERQVASVLIIPLLSMHSDPLTVIDIYEKTLRPTDFIPKSLFSLLYLGTVATSYSLTGHPSVGLGIINAIRAEAERQGYSGLLSYCYANMAYLFYASKQCQNATDYAHKAQTISGEWEDRDSRALCHAILAIQALKDQRPSQAIALISALPDMALQTACLAYPDLFFDLFFEANRLQVSLHPHWNVHKFYQVLTRHKSRSHQVLSALYEILRNSQRDAAFWPAPDTINPLVQTLQDAQLFLPLGNFSLWLAKRAEKLGRHDQLHYYGQLAYVALSGLSMDVFPARWKSWLDPEKKASQQVSTILKISRTISSLRSLEDLYSGIVDLLGQVTYSERRALFLVDGQGQLHLKAVRNFPKRPNTAVMNFIKQVAHDQRGIVLEGSEGEGSQLGVPLVLHGRTLGVLYEENEFRSQALGAQSLEILNTFAMQLAITLDNVQAHERLEHLSRRLKKENRYYHEFQKSNIQGHGIIGRSPGISTVLEQIEMVANLDTSVLVTGETGVGKELVAACIHYESHRQDGAFVVTNCAALSAGVIESELFGHEKGAFTGADQRKIGRFELADNGTLFLDEVGELPLELQAKLLRVLQSQEFYRVGGNKLIRSNFRLVAATNRNLAEAVQQGRFRRDLYYRLNVFPLEIPPLRERQEDIQLLAEHFIKEFSQTMGKSIEPLSHYQLQQLIQYPWPGNVRELRHVIERAVILTRNGELRFDNIHYPSTSETHLEEDILVHEDAELPSLDDAIRQHIFAALRQCKGKIHGPDGAAALLKMNPNTLRSKMMRLGMTTKKVPILANAC